MEGSQLGVLGGEGSSALKLRGSGEEKALGRPPPSALTRGLARNMERFWGL